MAGEQGAKNREQGAGDKVLGSLGRARMPGDRIEDQQLARRSMPGWLWHVLTPYSFPSRSPRLSS